MTLIVMIATGVLVILGALISAVVAVSILGEFQDYDK